MLRMKVDAPKLCSCVFACNQCQDSVTLPAAGAEPVLPAASFAAATALLCKVAALM